MHHLQPDLQDVSIEVHVLTCAICRLVSERSPLLGFRTERKPGDISLTIAGRNVRVVIA